MMYAAAGSVDWDGQDMAGTVGDTQSSKEDCAARCAATANCEYFTYWISNSACHLQDASAELRAVPSTNDSPTVTGHKDATDWCANSNIKMFSYTER